MDKWLVFQLSFPRFPFLSGNYEFIEFYFISRLMKVRKHFILTFSSVRTSFFCFFLSIDCLENLFFLLDKIREMNWTTPGRQQFLIRQIRRLCDKSNSFFLPNEFYHQWLMNLAPYTYRRARTRPDVSAITSPPTLYYVIMLFATLVEHPSHLARHTWCYIFTLTYLFWSPSRLPRHNWMKPLSD